MVKQCLDRRPLRVIWRIRNQANQSTCSDKLANELGEIRSVGLTPNITNPRATEYANQLGRRSSVITDWNDVAKGTILAFTDGVEYIDKIIRRAPP